MTGRPEGAGLAVTFPHFADTAAAARLQQGIRGLPLAIHQGWSRRWPGFFRHDGTARIARFERCGRPGRACRIAAARDVQRAAPTKPAPLPLRRTRAAAWLARGEAWRGPWLSRIAAEAGSGIAPSPRNIPTAGRSGALSPCARAPDPGTAPRCRSGPGIVRSLPLCPRGGRPRRASPAAARRAPAPAGAATAGRGPARRARAVAAAGGCTPRARA